MSKLRSVNTQFWSDPWVEELTPSEKLLYLYFITNEKTNMLGVYEMSIRKISFETGIDSKTIEKALKGFETIGKVKYTKNYIILLNFAKHQNYNTNMKKSAIDVYNGLPKELKINDEVINKVNASEGFERVLNRLGMVRKIEIEIEEEIEVEEEEENEEKNPKKDSSSVNKKLTKKEAEKAFIEWFNIRRSKALNLKSNLKALSETDKRNFHRLKDEYNYNSNDFNKAFNGMLKNGWAKETNNITPKHFLVNDNFNKYYLMGSDESQKKPLTLSEITRNQYHG